MNLSECLLYRDISELGEIATLYNCECNRNSKLELVQSIHHYMLNKDIHREVLQKMERALLYYVIYILFQPKRLFTINELIIKGNYVCQQFHLDASPRTWVSYLLKKGWLFPTSSKYQMQLEIPADLHIFLKKQFITFWLGMYGLERESSSIAGECWDEGEQIVFDLYLFLDHLKQLPVPLTLEGVIFKKHQQLLMQKFHIKEPLITDKDWRFGYGRRFPAYANRFALIYDFCYEKGWINEGEGVLTLTYKGEAFLNQEQEIPCLQKELREYWLKLYKIPIPTLPFLFGFITEILTGRWLRLSELYNLVSPWLKEYYFDDVHTVYRQRVIQMLVHLGVLQVTIDWEYVTIKKSL